MPLPSSGAISMSQVNVELGRSSTASINLNETAVRTLFGKASGTISLSDGYGKANAVSLTITTNQQNLTLSTWASSNGWNGSTAANITINSGVYIWSSSIGTPALTTGSFPGGLTIINNGFIMGCGGDGHGYINNSSANLTPTSGGAAISLGTSCTITNNSYIGGGGGGGAGGPGGGGAGGGRGGQITQAASTTHGFAGAIGASGTNGAFTASGNPQTVFQMFCGAGGGGRVFPGTGGAGGRPGASNGVGIGGSAGGGGGARAVAQYGTLTLDFQGGAGGSGGAAGGNGTIYTGTTSGGYPGGGGGGWGAAGGAYPGNPTAPGAGGRAISLNGYTCTRNGSGTTYGAVS